MEEERRANHTHLEHRETGVHPVPGTPGWAGSAGPGECGLCEGLPQPLPEGVQKHPPTAGSPCLILQLTLMAQGTPQSLRLTCELDYKWLGCHISCDRAPGTHMWILGYGPEPAVNTPTIPAFFLAPSISLCITSSKKPSLTPSPSWLGHPCPQLLQDHLLISPWYKAL